MKRILLVILAICHITNSQPILVDVHHFPPCVIIEEDKITGFDIELFETITNNLDIKYEYVTTPQFKDIFTNLQTSQADAAIAAITITSEREKNIDFSHPYLESGLSILICNETNVNVLKVIFKYLTTAFRPLLVFFIYVLISAILIWFIEIGNDSFSDNIWKGIGDGIYWTVTTMTTVGYGDKTPRKPIGKVFAMINMFIGIGIIYPFFIAQMSQIFVQQHDTVNIQSIDDLEGKKVAVVEGTTSVDALRLKNIKLTECKKIDDCYTKLKEKEVLAVVNDMPALKYFVKNNEGYKIVGEMFDNQDYGIAFPENSKLREQFNIELLRLMKTNKYLEIKKKWFGK